MAPAMTGVAPAMSLLFQLFRLFLRSGQRRVLRLRDPVGLRASLRRTVALTTFMPFGVAREDIHLGGLPVRVLHNRRRSARPGHVLLYLHGGGFVFGSPDTHQAFVARVMIAGGFESAWLPDYRLAPEHPFPAAIDDCLTAWQTLSARAGNQRLCVAGESAGGNLALLLCQRIRDLGLARPERAWLLSPWLDIALGSDDPGPDFREDLMLGADPVAARDWVRQRFSAAYAPGMALDDPALSPVHGRLDDLPPLFVQAGSDEIFAADSLLLRQRADAAGADMTLEVWRGMPHAFAFFTPWLPEARSAVRRAGHWLRHGQPAPHDTFSPLHQPR